MNWIKIKDERINLDRITSYVRSGICVNFYQGDKWANLEFKYRNDAEAEEIISWLDGITMPFINEPKHDKQGS